VSGNVQKAPDMQKTRPSRLLRNTDLIHRYGRTQRTLDRWKLDKILPAPDLVINGAPYWYETTIEANEKTRLSGKPSEAASPAA